MILHAAPETTKLIHPCVLLLCRGTVVYTAFVGYTYEIF